MLEGKTRRRNSSVLQFYWDKYLHLMRIILGKWKNIDNFTFFLIRYVWKDGINYPSRKSKSLLIWIVRLFFRVWSWPLISFWIVETRWFFFFFFFVSFACMFLQSLQAMKSSSLVYLLPLLVINKGWDEDVGVDDFIDFIAFSWYHWRWFQIICLNFNVD